MSYLTYEWLWRNGRLGNQLWQIASTAGIAAREGLEPRFPKWEYQPFFRVPEEFFVDKLPRQRRDLGTDYLQELHYFSNIESKVREWFRPSEDVVKWLVSEHTDVTLGDEHFTSLHVRRGDYVGLPKHFPFPGLKYYRRAIDLVRAEWPDTHFLVFSDDPAWCRQQFSNLKGATFVEGVTRPVEMVDRTDPPQDHLDLFLMTMCDKHIIGNSTFSWWGAYLSDNTQVIHPSRWYGPALGEIPWHRMIPETWIEVPV